MRFIPRAALAHGGEDLAGPAIWSTWGLTPEISGPIILIVALYLRGALRRRTASRPIGPARHTAFFAGVLMLFVSLQSPIDPLGERLFFVHQIQHFLLRMLGPMLVVLARPQGVLVAGLPEQLRRGLAAPLVKNGALSGLFSFLTRPVVAFALFVASLYVWQLPSLHNAALLDPLIHWTMHLTMLGAITVFKTSVLYPAYAIKGRPFDIAPLTDESVGGFILWVPSSMMMIITIIIVVVDWNQTEKKRVRRNFSHTGAQIVQSASGDERTQKALSSGRLGMLLGLAALSIFSLIIGTGVFVVSLG